MNCVFPRRDVDVLTPTLSEGELLWDRVVAEVVKMESHWIARVCPSAIRLLS